MIDGPKIKLEDFGGWGWGCAATTMRHLVIAFVFPAGSCLCSRLLPLAYLRKNKRFCVDGFSLGSSDSFLNSKTATDGWRCAFLRNTLAPPVLCFRVTNGNVQSACLNVLLRPNNRSVSPSVISLPGLPRQCLYPHHTFPICRSRALLTVSEAHAALTLPVFRSESARPPLRKAHPRMLTS